MLVANPLCWFCRDAAQMFLKSSLKPDKQNLHTCNNQCINNKTFVYELVLNNDPIVPLNLVTVDFKTNKKASFVRIEMFRLQILNVK
jgi:hypothetical protein